MTVINCLGLLDDRALAPAPVPVPVPVPVPAAATNYPTPAPLEVLKPPDKTLKPKLPPRPLSKVFSSSEHGAAVLQVQHIYIYIHSFQRHTCDVYQQKQGQMLLEFVGGRNILKTRY